jgi:hypothetical protein
LSILERLPHSLSILFVPCPLVSEYSSAALSRATQESALRVLETSSPADSGPHKHASHQRAHEFPWRSLDFNWDDCAAVWIDLVLHFLPE